MWADMAMDLAKQFEGCSLTAYPDPAKGWAIPTIGYGATGPDIYRSLVWTQEQADADLKSRIEALGPQIDRCVPMTLTDEMKGAMVDLAYNIGIGAFQGSTLLEKLRAGDPQGAADEFPKWNQAGGKVLPGLVKRRDAERALFLLGCNFEVEK